MSLPAPLLALTPHPVPSGVDASAEAERITQASGTSFAAGMAILPRPRREAMRAVYAYCRMIDDIADGDFAPALKREALDLWRGEIEALYAGRPVSAVGRALLEPVAAFDLPREEFILLLEGMEMDADGPVVAPSREQLSAYTRRVAGAVGVLSIRIFGAWRGEVSDRFALALADAFQLTNILRDIEEDAAIGRLYLPRELLQENGVPVDDPQAAASAPGLIGVCRSLGGDARRFYDEARRLAAEHERRALRPALLMMGAYEGYLDQMERRAWRRDAGPVTQSRFAKLMRGLRYAYAGPGPARQPVERVGA
jgi:phytoene synthase